MPDAPQILRLRAIMQSMFTVGGDLNLNMVISFLTVAAYPGRSAKAYQDMLGHSQSTMSRHLLDLGPRNRKLGAGLGLLDQRKNPDDWRYNVHTLTPKGIALLDSLTQLLASTERSQ